LSVENIEQKLSGKIVLSIEESGEVWYIKPSDNQGYYLGRPLDTFNLIWELSLGITNKDFDKISNDILLQFAGMYASRASL